MRYSYLEAFLEEDPNAIDIRYENPNAYAGWEPNWIESSDRGLRFGLDEHDDETLRRIDIKVEETHPLFNFGLLEKLQYQTGIATHAVRVECFIKLNIYGAKQFKKAGIPITISETHQYDDQEEQG